MIYACKQLGLTCVRNPLDNRLIKQLLNLIQIFNFPDNLVRTLSSHPDFYFLKWKPALSAGFVFESSYAYVTL
jgi:hypothetical protein